MTEEQRKELDRLIDDNCASVVIRVLMGDVTEPTSLHLAVATMLGRAGAFGDLSTKKEILSPYMGVRGQMLRHAVGRATDPTPPVEG